MDKLVDLAENKYFYYYTAHVHERRLHKGSLIAFCKTQSRQRLWPFLASRKTSKNDAALANLEFILFPPLV